MLPKSVEADRLDESEPPELKPDERSRLEEPDELDDRDELYELDEPKPLDRLELELLLDVDDDLLELELEPKPELFAQPSGVVSKATEAARTTRRTRVIYFGDQDVRISEPH